MRALAARSGSTSPPPENRSSNDGNTGPTEEIALPKGKKGKPHGPAEVLVVEAEVFPSAVIVELWHKNAKGKREFLDSRRYDVAEEIAELVLAVADEQR